MLQQNSTLQGTQKMLYWSIYSRDVRIQQGKRYFLAFKKSGHQHRDTQLALEIFSWLTVDSHEDAITQQNQASYIEKPVNRLTFVDRKENPMVKLMTQADFAKQQHVSRQYIHKLVKEGKIVLHEGKINPEQAKLVVNVLERPSKNSEECINLSKELLKARVQNEKTKGQLLDIKLKQESEELVNADDIRKALFNKARTIRDTLLNIPDRIAPVLATIDNTHEIHEMLTAEITQALEELAQDNITSNQLID